MHAAGTLNKCPTGHERNRPDPTRPAPPNRTRPDPIRLDPCVSGASVGALRLCVRLRPRIAGFRNYQRVLRPRIRWVGHEGRGLGAVGFARRPSQDGSAFRRQRSPRTNYPAAAPATLARQLFLLKKFWLPKCAIYLTICPVNFFTKTMSFFTKNITFFTKMFLGPKIFSVRPGQARSEDLRAGNARRRGCDDIEVRPNL